MGCNLSEVGDLMSHAVLFPGQGSQFVGMSREHYEQSEQFRKRLDEADAILGYSLTGIMYEGPEETLGRRAIPSRRFFFTLSPSSSRSISDLTWLPATVWVNSPLWLPQELSVLRMDCAWSLCAGN